MFNLFKRKEVKTFVGDYGRTLDACTKTALLTLARNHEKRLAKCAWYEIEAIKAKVASLRSLADSF